MNSHLPSDGTLTPAIQRLLRAVEPFLRVETASAVLLLVSTAAALVWVNIAGDSYAAFWRTELTHGPGPQLLKHSLHFWINDGLMTLFFLLVGLEIRAEMRDGVLANPRQAVLPMVAALGGVLVPALIFLGLNSDPLLRRGWAVPMATDIAFSAGALALLGNRVPRPLRILLLTLAIVDDIAAVVVIATFYSSGIALEGVIIAGCALIAVLGLNALGVRQALVYAIPGAVLWVGLLRAGIHPTLAGVAVGVMLPVSSGSRHDVRTGSEPPEAQGVDPVHVHLKEVLHSWVAFLIMPLFALANAGVVVVNLVESAKRFPSLAGGVLLGLVIGKPLGILVASALCVKLGVGILPPEIRWRHMIVLGCLGGIGFTMSIFLADLAFPPGDLLVTAKSAILVASAVAAIGGIVVGRCALQKPAGVPADSLCNP